MRLLRGNVEEFGCTIDVEHSQDSLHAHVTIDGDRPLGPGDKVRVHGEPVRLCFGERLTLRRRATITRATLLERLWTKIAARFELAELYEVSFTSRRF